MGVSFRGASNSPLARYIRFLTVVPFCFTRRLERDAEALRLLNQPALPIIMRRAERAVHLRWAKEAGVRTRHAISPRIWTRRDEEAYRYNVGGCDAEWPDRRAMRLIVGGSLRQKNADHMRAVLGAPDEYLGTGAGLEPKLELVRAEFERLLGVATTAANGDITPKDYVKESMRLGELTAELMVYLKPAEVTESEVAGPQHASSPTSTDRKCNEVGQTCLHALLEHVRGLRHWCKVPDHSVTSTNGWFNAAWEETNRSFRKAGFDQSEYFVAAKSLINILHTNSDVSFARDDFERLGLFEQELEGQVQEHATKSDAKALNGEPVVALNLDARVLTWGTRRYERLTNAMMKALQPFVEAYNAGHPTVKLVDVGLQYDGGFLRQAFKQNRKGEPSVHPVAGIFEKVAGGVYKIKPALE